MNLSQLEVFAAIVDHGSLTEAAEVVGLTQSAVSYSLSKLEAELGVVLLERSRQGIVVTRIGEEILGHARQILAQAEVIRQKTARERGMAVGRLRLGCVTQMAPQLLAGIIRDFQHHYPEIDVTVFEGNPYELLGWLENGTIDLSTIINPQGHRSSVTLAEDEIVVLASKKHPFASLSEVTLSMMSDQSLIGPRATFDFLAKLPGLSSTNLPRLRYDVSLYNTIHAMVRENMGISLSPAKLSEIQPDGIVALPLSPRIRIRVYLAASIDSPAAQAFMSTAQQWALEHGYLPQDV